ncbi:MAG: hypothetical protein HRT37_03080 [Alteromonadaceae bacterium]|nr:hypothetical protein [Alteromonadaceae bacterium]
MKMFKLKSKITVFFWCFITFSGCGLKGPLYQTPENTLEQEKQEQAKQEQSNSESLKKQND